MYPPAMSSDDGAAGSTVGGSGWYGLLGILRANSEDMRQQATLTPVACPHDGEPLLTGPQGQLYCPFDGWKPGDDD